MNFAFSEEQEELRKHRPPVPRDQVARGRGPRADGDRAGLRRRRLDPDGRAARPPGPRSSPRSSAARATATSSSSSCSRRWAASLLCAPYFSTVVLAANTLLHSGDDAAKADLLPGIASGETIATLAFTEDNGRWDEAGITATATDVGRRLDARRHEDVRARRPHRRPDPRRRPHRRRREPLRRRRRRRRPHPHARCPPWTRPASRPSSSSPTPRPRLIGTDGGGWAVLERVLDLAAVALAAEQVGGAQMCLEMAVEYAKDRVQFGRPIGSFQAIKHKCADMLLEVESAKSAAYYAGWCAAELNDELPVGGQPGQGLLLGGLLPRRRREHPDPRRHRLHLGAPGPPVLQAGQVAPSCCSAIPPTTASCSPSASASEAPTSSPPRAERAMPVSSLR